MVCAVSGSANRWAFHGVLPPTLLRERLSGLFVENQLEHWISHDVQQSFSVDGKLYVSGRPYNNGEEVAVSTKSFGYRVLCERHNSALGRLDTVAGNLFRVLYGYQKAHADPASAASLGASQIGLFSGPEDEAVAPKTAFGRNSCSRVWSQWHCAHKRPVRNTDYPALINTLFRGSSWPKGWGFYLPAVLGEELTELAPLTFEVSFRARWERMAIGCIDWGSEVPSHSW